MGKAFNGGSKDDKKTLKKEVKRMFYSITSSRVNLSVAYFTEWVTLVH
jgi:hypothetical protein